MNLCQYLGKKIKVTFTDNQILSGFYNGFTGKFDADDELYDEIKIESDKHKYVGFNESEVKEIGIIN